MCVISNKRHVININALHESLGLEFCKVLPGFHALTGCDYNPAFFRKGKQRPYKMLLKSKEYQKAFADLGNTTVDKENTFSIVESFVCDMYGIKSCNEVNNLRYELFHQNYTIKNVHEPFQKKTFEKLRCFLLATLLRRITSADGKNALYCKYMDECYSI